MEMENILTEEIASEEDFECEEEEEIGTLDLDSFKDTSSFSLDLNAEMVEQYYKKGKFVFNPDFQRRYVWDTKRKSKFIESLMLNIPIPSILLADNREKNEFIIIDGKQRLKTIVEFICPEKDNVGFKLTGLEVLKELNGYTYKRLLEDVSKIEMLSSFQTYTFKASIVRNYNEKLLYFIFARLNSGSVQLSTQELRHTLFPGEFSKFINLESLVNKNIKKILKLPADKCDSRMKDAELLCRYYAFKYYWKTYNSTVGALLDYTYKEINKNWENLEREVKEDLTEFNLAVNFVYKILGDDAFKIYSPEENRYLKFNRLVFDLLCWWFSVDKHRNIVLSNNEIKPYKKYFEEMFKNKDFSEAFKPVTSSQEKTLRRFKLFEDYMNKYQNGESNDKSV